MAILIRMPELLAGMTEAVIQGWLVSVGDELKAESPLAEIETEKAMVEFTSERGGTVVELLVLEGESVAVGSPIAILREPGDSDAGVDAVRPVGTAPMTASKTALTTVPITAEPVAAPLAETKSAAIASEPSPTPGRRFISPIVRRIARELDIDLSHISGTGPNGRIVRRDLANLAQSGGIASTVPPSTVAPKVGRDAGETIPITGMRAAIARRLSESKSTVPHFYLTAHCRVDELLEMRRAVNATATRKISVNDFVVKAAAQAFSDVPEANTIWGGDHLLRFNTVDIAIAVSTDGGLLTPVVRDVNALSLTACSETIAELATRARAGRLKQHELEGGSFSISNLGMYGVDEFSAILNPPQSGILAVGAATEHPIVIDGELAAGTVMTVTLSADHRVVDGALGAQWLKAFKTRIENPISILV